MLRVPFITVTGFLGSGKTTLINSYLRFWRNERVLVLVNELGDIGIDHELIVKTKGPAAIALTGGCLCCAYRGALAGCLVEALGALGSSDPLARIVIETSGLASPARVEQELMSDPDLAPRLRLGGIVACLDVVAPPWSHSTRPIALEQLAIADQIVLTKGKLAMNRISQLAAFAAGVNPDAQLIEDPFGQCGSARADASPLRVGRLATRSICIASTPHPEVERVILRPPAGSPSVAYDWILRLCAAAGEALLRLKGFVRASSTDRTYAVHAVAGLVYPLVALPEASRPAPALVLIGNPGLRLAIQSVVAEWAADRDL
jgi:G3E family GTPase